VFDLRLSGVDILLQVCKSSDLTLPAATLAQWLVDKNVVDLLIPRSDPHYEIIRRSSPIFSFLAMNGKLAESHVITLWSATSSNDPTLVQSVYNTFADLSKDKDTEQKFVKPVFISISRKQFCEMQLFDLEFIKKLTETATYENKWSLVE
jgi:hypothetical protein